ncbi:bis(5'-nucleosyl)-tetraphosphatase (symmetrical) [Chromatiales bacterium (ex Bugula neritina AB1)]|nr:bis(5'-nucleosyl)-tetraphosphatase (symmetrical) [Chromatiales bacterium (ex Bugula neritina AB1)]
MAIYAIGDIQGCNSALQRLLEKLKFDPAQDTLWFAGDLVNRGPESLETLRFVKSLGSASVTVLGNHDIHLLALYYGLRPKGKAPTLQPILDAPDADELICWLQHLPVLHQQHGYALVHAGLYPQWNMQTATTLAREVEAALRNTKDSEALSTLYGPSANTWAAAKDSPERLRFAVNCFTRMRFCNQKAELDFEHNGAPGSQPDHLVPWFDVPERVLAPQAIIFGHWAALGLYTRETIFALDSGCVWGNALTAMRIRDRKLVSVDCSL